jgi:hypothetical protein
MNYEDGRIEEMQKRIDQLEKDLREEQSKKMVDATSVIASIHKQVERLKACDEVPSFILMTQSQFDSLSEHDTHTMKEISRSESVRHLGAMEKARFEGIPIRIYGAHSFLLPVTVVSHLELSSFRDMWNRLAETVHKIAVEHGWWGTGDREAMLIVLQKLNVAINKGEPNSVIAKLEEEFRSHSGNRPVSENLALIHSEVSEHLEGMRHGNPQSDKIPFSNAEEEIADVIIREMDLCEREGWNAADAIEAKIIMNASRAFKHGGKKF